ncbi:LuxR family transcriptional regulator [Actinoplanes sichuanensis]|uniref:ATP-binding protein n=1 Tax=Actinoplanes sichuanensis TaxID=512349 RepID=A0ABW4A0C7_9ACTN|nr:LuxR C-terminal-related transcriptional regulator [Actinoplanes sichuanensis]BEL08189.1 LuxR family transcriptional regulator [Actinoplanes sichuanensis]
MGTATSARGTAGNLPAELTSFVGRRQEVTGIRRMLSTSRLVTLTGPGGVGKTRLAQRVGADLRRAFPDGIWFVGLAELHDPDLVAVTVGETLGLHEDMTGLDPAGLARFLADRQMLLILDNCEHLVAACAQLAETLLRSCADLRVLATSREALRVDGEAVLSVQPLSVPGPTDACNPGDLQKYESAGLFVDRATAVLPGFRVTEDNCATIVRLCRALEGVPLAIELAVARLRVLSLDQILDRLTDRYRLLTTGARTAPPRQQTLRALIDWSWDLCSEPERILWSRVSVFSGGFELDAVEAVCADDRLPVETVLDVLGSLVEKSVLIRSGNGTARYQILEVTREYGAAELATAGEHEEMTRRHCRWFADLAAHADRIWVGPQQTAVMERLRHERANLRVALEHATTQGPPETALRFAADLQNHWFVRGYFSEGRHWLDRALAMPAPRHWTRVKALRVAAWIAGIQGDADRAGPLLAEAVALAGTLPASPERAYLPLIEGVFKLWPGDYEQALPLLERALAAFRELNIRNGELWTLIVLGLCRGLADQPSSGYPDLIAARDLGAATGEVWWQSFGLWALSVLRWRDGDHAGATAAAKECLAVGKAVDGEQFAVGLGVESLAWIAAHRHRDQRAATLLGVSRRMWQEMHTSLAPFRVLQSWHDEVVEQVRSRLGADAFSAAVRRGSELSTADAIVLAVEGRARAPEPEPTDDVTAGLRLTRREREVAALIAEGLSNRDIATRLVVAQRTAEGHVENLLSKLGFTSRTQVAGWLAGQKQPPPD